MAPRHVLKLGVHLSNHGPAAECVELARLAEAEGLDSVWISEDLYFRGAVPLAGAIAAVTSRIEIGFGILTPQIRHVALLAMDSAALVDIAGPRLIMGIGAGVALRTQALAVAPVSPVAAVRDAVDVYRRLLAGESVTIEEGTQRATGLQMTFPDLPPTPPVYVAAVGPRALEQAGRIADGVFLSLMSSHRHIAWALERVRAGIAEASRSVELPIVVYLPFAVSDRSQEAVDSLKPLIAYWLRRWMPIPSLAALFTEWGPLSRDAIVALVSELGAGRPAESVIPDELVLDYCIAGSLDDCRRQVERLASEGVTDIVVDPTGDMAARRARIAEFARLRATLR